MTTSIDTKKAGRLALTIVLRCLLVLFTIVVLAFVGLCMTLNLIFNGPSESARDVLTMSLLESSAMKWVPAVFIGEETVAQIQNKDTTPLPEDVSDISQIVIDINSASSDEWKDYPDGIRIETVYGGTYTAHVMLIRDPSSVYLATSTDKFNINIDGTRIHRQIETEGAIAAINAGAFNDDGTAQSYIGSLPIGMVVSKGKILWDDGKSYDGFAGLTEDNILVVANTINRTQVEELKIRDGCCFGPVLLMNGTVNDAAYNSNSGYNPRTAIGQRSDGTIIFLCVDGRQAGSLGATHADLVNIMVGYGAVNACNLDGGASTVMLYRDNYGRYGTTGEVVMLNSYSLLQESPRKMPTFFMVRASGSEE